MHIVEKTHLDCEDTNDDCLQAASIPQESCWLSHICTDSIQTSCSRGFMLRSSTLTLYKGRLNPNIVVWTWVLEKKKSVCATRQNNHYSWTSLLAFCIDLHDIWLIKPLVLVWKLLADWLYFIGALTPVTFAPTKAGSRWRLVELLLFSIFYFQSFPLLSISNPSEWSVSS